MQVGDNLSFSLRDYTVPTGGLLFFDFTPYISTPFLLALGARGKLGNPGEPDPLGVKGIYQMRMTKRGKRAIKMKFYTPTNPQTAAQQNNRQKFADAMAAWSALTESEKSAYNERAKKRNMFGWGLFIREYYQFN